MKDNSAIFVIVISLFIIIFIIISYYILSDSMFKKININPEITIQSTDDKLLGDAIKEPIVIATAVDAHGRNMKPHVGFSLQTLGNTEEYWLDTGAFKI